MSETDRDKSEALSVKFRLGWGHVVAICAVGLINAGVTWAQFNALQTSVSDLKALQSNNTAALGKIEVRSAITDRKLDEYDNRLNDHEVRIRTFERKGNS